MSKLLLLQTPHITPKIHRRVFTTLATLSTPNFNYSPCPLLTKLHFPSSPHTSYSNHSAPFLLYSISSSIIPLHAKRFSARAFDDSSETVNEQQQQKKEKVSETKDESFPDGEFVYEERSAWKNFVVKLRMLIAFPWQRVRKGSVLNMKLRGQISDQLKSRFSSGLSLPQICENFIKAAYDPRVAGIYLHIEPLNCGWGKVEEIRRHILDFRKSGKFIIGYVPVCGEKEYYLGCACEELYAPPSAYFFLYGLSVQASFLGGIALLKMAGNPNFNVRQRYRM